MRQCAARLVSGLALVTSMVSLLAGAPLRAQPSRIDAGGAVPAGRKVFDRPQLGENRLDWCRAYAVDCGEAAAQAFCRAEGFARAIDFQGPDMEPTATLTIGSRKPCLGAGCGGFYSITCEAAAEAGRSEEPRRQSPDPGPAGADLEIPEELLSTVGPPDPARQARIERRLAELFGIASIDSARGGRETEPEPSTPSSGFGSEADGWTVTKGTTLKFYSTPDAGRCRSDCAAKADCRGYTWVKPGGYRAGDPPMCYLMSLIEQTAPHPCCVTASKSDTTEGRLPGND